MSDNVEINITFEGMEKLRAFVKEAPKALHNSIMKELDDLANKTERNARLLAPRDTGRLQDSIHATKAKPEGKGYSATIGTNVEYALYVHEINQGRGPETARKSDVQGYQPGRKFLTNAMKITEEQVDQAIMNAIERAIE